MAQKGRGEAFVNCDTLLLLVGWSCLSRRVSENWVSSGRSGHAAGTGETTTRSLWDNWIGWDRVQLKRGLGYCAWAPTKEGETSRRGRRGLGYCAWALTTLIIFFWSVNQDILFFFWPLSRVQWSGVVGVPQAAVPVGNVDVAGTWVWHEVVGES